MISLYNTNSYFCFSSTLIYKNINQYNEQSILNVELQHNDRTPHGCRWPPKNRAYRFLD